MLEEFTKSRIRFFEKINTSELIIRQKIIILMTACFTPDFILLIKKEENKPFFSISVFFLPYAIDMDELLPRQSPIITDVRKVISVYD